MLTRCRELYKVEQVTQSASSYLIKLNIGERIYVMRCGYKTECQRWVEALKIAATTARELAVSKTKKSRNISKLVELYQTGRAALEQAMSARREIWIPTGKKWAGTEELFSACNNVKSEFVVVSCFV